ncbi:DNA repair protein [Hahella chejuensis KCTC 2396]|uniref:DNA repair protein n=1 Tax=Hahella chejuensis (strain KCTC 2396) TaxID=349521 RepID=Q2SPA2_HAHCH|nr:DNA repair protein RadC [Hahella chejuensis]ABC27522.1 DNA repair protein [Hahella chejuensis KCTC 2396]
MKGDQIIKQALTILTSRLTQPGAVITSPELAYDFLKLKLAELQYEVFGVMFLDNQHRVIEFDAMFRGTFDKATIHVREIAKKALLLNAAAVILSHNHPSQNSTPSQADIRITEEIKKSLNFFEVRVLDHVIIGGTNKYSFAENGLL